MAVRDLTAMDQQVENPVLQASWKNCHFCGEGSRWAHSQHHLSASVPCVRGKARGATNATWSMGPKLLPCTPGRCRAPGRFPGHLLLWACPQSFGGELWLSPVPASCWLEEHGICTSTVSHSVPPPHSAQAGLERVPHPGSPHPFLPGLHRLPYSQGTSQSRRGQRVPGGLWLHVAACWDL